MHDSPSGSQYVSTSPGGVAHILDLDAAEIINWFHESPYTCVEQKGVQKTLLHLGGGKKHHSVHNRPGHPPYVCSFMRRGVPTLNHDTISLPASRPWSCAMRAVEMPERITTAHLYVVLSFSSVFFTCLLHFSRQIGRIWGLRTDSDAKQRLMFLLTVPLADRSRSTVLPELCGKDGERLRVSGCKRGAVWRVRRADAGHRKPDGVHFLKRLEEWRPAQAVGPSPVIFGASRNECGASGPLHGLLYR